LRRRPDHAEIKADRHGLLLILINPNPLRLKARRTAASLIQINADAR